MKKLSAFLYVCLDSECVQSGFSKAEYFFDTDPGVNNGTTIYSDRAYRRGEFFRVDTGNVLIEWFPFFGYESIS